MGEKKRKQQAASQAPGKAVDAMTLHAQQWLQTGKQSHQGGRLIDAINAYQQALQYSPRLVEARHCQGVAMVQLGQGPLGIHLMRLALEQNDDNARLHFDLGIALRAIDDAASLRHLEAAAILAPDDLGFAFAHADALRRQRRLEEAIVVLERARTLNPSRVQTLRTLAELYFRIDRLTLARQRFEQALALDPPLSKTTYIGFANPRAGDLEQETVLHRANLAGTVLKDDTALKQLTDELDLHIVDDFLSDPVTYRSHALSLPFHKQHYAGQNYPGIQTDGYPCQDIMERIAAALGRTVKFMSPDNGSYRLSFADSSARTDIHVDHEAGDNFNYYAAVLYLNLPEQCQGGTTFWKHSPTGWLRRPADSDVRAAGYPNFKAFQKRWLPNAQVLAFNQLKQRREVWQAVLEVPMRHNRLIVYRGHYFHSMSDVFGSTPDNGRLVQLFFFEVLDHSPSSGR